MGRCVIAAYRPRPGHEAALAAAVRDHVPLLRAEGFATDRAATVMRAADGTVIEVFEWVSREAIDAAHLHPAVQALWARFASACEHLPLVSLAEARDLFAEFEALDEAAA